MRSESGQPLRFLPGLPDRSGVTGQPNGQFFAQPVDHMARPGRVEHHQR